ncbi:MAG: dihydroorotate dehydrogenase electron transfer subunit [Elusimicrobiota bacterium]|jgi:dihydroorotate dehydrogenase electron transfer subunit|nr:dihydroorotate dehydrogenase electron transfer subunit [Elusimicrobiota bacterium]
MNNFKAKVLESAQAAPGIFKIKFSAPALAAGAKPGRFLEVLCTGPNAPFLRRPFGIHDVEGGAVYFIFKKTGRGTELLSNLKPGDFIDVTAPLGNGFEIQKTKEHLLAAGGMGAAPLLLLARRIKESGQTCKIFLAARAGAEIICADEFKKYGEVFISAEDGAKGEKCMIDAPLERALKEAKNAALYACGSVGMLRCVAGLGAKYKVNTQVSLEEKMACGMGVCQGCPVEVKNKDTKYKMVCKDGPVFNAEDIVW